MQFLTITEEQAQQFNTMLATLRCISMDSRFINNRQWLCYQYERDAADAIKGVEPLPVDMPTDQIISPEDISKARVVNSISIIAVLFALAAVLLMCSSCTKRMPDEPRVKKCNIQRPVPNWFPPAWHFIDTSKLGTIKH